MSGGHFDYLDQSFFNNFYTKINCDIVNSVDIEGRVELIQQLKEITKIVGNLIYTYDLFMSGDTSEEFFKKELEKAKIKLKELK